MVSEEKHASIADASKPNAGRIYDFVLGGNHNFEVDRVAAAEAVKLIPLFPKLARLVRWFLGEAVRRLVAGGFTQFIDFASGLPTMDHIHHVAGPGTKVIDSHLDPVTVAYGQEIIKDLPNVRYVVCPAENPEILLNSPTVASLLGADHRVAIGFNGISYFIPDDKLAHSMQVLHAWAAKGSRLFLCDLGDESSSNTHDTAAMKLFQKLDQPVFWRSKDRLIEICRPWTVREPGFQPLEDWIGARLGVAEASRIQGFSMIAAILEK